MTISSMREFKKIYNPKMGRYMYQHYSGGQFYRHLRDINPKDFKGITGLGHQPTKATHHLQDHVADSEEQAIEIGDAIINRLRLRNNKGQDLHTVSDSKVEDVRKRVKTLMQANGLQV